MRGKSRFLIVAAGVLEILYGLAFVCMGVACSYLSTSTAIATSSGDSGASSSVWQINDMSSYMSPVRRDLLTTPNRKDISGHGIWLAVLYTVTGFLGVIAGQENDRIIPLLHTVLSLVCIAWAPLMFEILYLLLRPASIYPYNFLTEMDLILSQKHWAAYIVSICVAVAGSALYLFSAALTAYQYGIRMIDRNLPVIAPTGGALNFSPAVAAVAQPRSPTTNEQKAKPASPNGGNKVHTKPLHQLTLPLKQSTAPAPEPESAQIVADAAPKFIKHSRTDAPLHHHGQLTSSMTLPHAHTNMHRQHQLVPYSTTERTGTMTSRSDMDLMPSANVTNYAAIRNAYARPHRERDQDQDHIPSGISRNHHLQENLIVSPTLRRAMRDREREPDSDRMDRDGRILYGFGDYYDNSQEATV